MKCEIEGYIERQEILDIPRSDWTLLRNAAAENKKAIQHVWDGGTPPMPMVIRQPSARHFRVVPGKSCDLRLVYHDALSDQLAAIESALKEGALVIPMVLCDMNVLAVSSLFNPELVPDCDGEDANVSPCLCARRDVEQLEKPGIDGGLMPVILSETRRLRAMMPEWLYIGVRMNTGPLSLAAELRGATALLEDMLEAPDLFHKLMEIMTDLYIEVRDAIHAAAGIAIRPGEVRPDVSVHAPTTGVMICDDSIVLMGPDHFAKFVLPYLRRIFRKYGGGTLHSCGAWDHLWPVLRDVHEISGFEFGQGNLVDWSAARAALPDRNLIFWDLGAEGRDYMEQARSAALEPRTFVYSINPDHTRYWMGKSTT